ncbi:MAG: hypothetical protein AB8B56_04810 [Crocinitomicaceae bacterium]
MKRILLLSLSTVLTGAVFAQGQIGNSDMENWEAVAGSDEEPVNWSSFLTAQGSLISFAANQIEESSEVRPGTTGTKSARIWTRDAGFNVKANGNMTCGRINMGSISASSPDNHNISLTSDPDFSEALTDTPDSIVFWVKYNADDSGSEARMKATLHDDFDYTDPETGTSADHIVATAELNYSPTNDTWVRKSVPFNYSGPATVNTYILVTFASNAIPGGGDVDDEVFIDDVELIYNDANTGEIPANDILVAMDNDLNMINVLTDSNLEGEYTIYNTAGQLVQSGDVASSIPFEERTGIYFFHINTAAGSYKFEIYKK